MNYNSYESLKDWPRERPNGRYVCSPEHPRPKDSPGYWAHTNVEEVGDQEDGYPGGDYQRYRCLDCGEEWKAELPQ